jgi:glycosyltransferase involved in cell wall biosynthesis
MLAIGQTDSHTLGRAPTDGCPLKLSILMPAYNEERTIIHAIDELLGVEYPCDVELIVVDDGSTDRTHSLLAEVRDPRVLVHRHPRNRGKGAGLMTAASLATGTHILPFDADLEYSAEDIPRMLRPVLCGRSDVVYGVRLFGYNTVYRSYRYAAGNRWLTRMANILFDACLSDMHTCLKLMPLSVLRGFSLSESGFGLDTEVTASLLRHGFRPFEVPVSYYSRSHAEGKKINWRDAVVCMWILLRMRVRTRKGLRCQPGNPGPELTAGSELTQLGFGASAALAASPPRSHGLVSMAESRSEAQHPASGTLI